MSFQQPFSIGANIDLSGVSSNWEPGKGIRSTLRYTGTENAIKGLANILRSTRPDLRWAFDNSEAPLWAIEVNQPESVDGQTNQDPPAVWELIGQDGIQDILDHPTSIALRAAAPDYMQLVISAIKEIERGDATATYPAISLGSDFIASSLAGKASNAIVMLSGSGHKTFMRGEYVLRKTQVINSRSEISLAFNQIDCIWSYDDLVASETTLPNVTGFSIAQIETPTFTANPISGNPLQFYWGWLKKTPSVVQTSGNRFQINQEWWLNIWNNFDYKVANSTYAFPQS